MLLNKLRTEGICPPKWVEDNCVLLVHGGSHSYGTNGPDSDYDIYGICIPPKRIVFPHTIGEIPGFVQKAERFDEFKCESGDYDVSIWSIVRFFRLAWENNPNILDILFVDDKLVSHITPVGHLIRENRHIFLHKLLYRKFYGYAYSQMRKIDRAFKGKRLEDITKYGYSLKFALNCIRLMLECEQILLTGSVDLMRNSQLLLSIKRGEWSKQRVLDFFNEYIGNLDRAYAKSTLPDEPRTAEIEALLIKCLEMHYGSIQDFVHPSKYEAFYHSVKHLVGEI